MKKEEPVMSLKKMWEYILFQSKEYRLMPFAVIIGSICGAGYAYINSILYARIIDTIILGAFDRVMYTVIVMIVSVWLLRVLDSVSRAIMETCVDSSDYVTRKRTARKVFSIHYGKFESEEVLNSLRKVRMGEMSTGGIAVQLDNICQFFSNVVKVVFAVAFLVVLITKTSLGNNANVWKIVLLTAFLVVFMVACAYVSVRITRKVTERENAINVENERANGEYGYLYNLISTEAADLNIRIYDCSDYFLKKNMSTNREMKKWTEFGRISGKLHGIIAMVMQLFAGYIYIYTAIIALSGTISIGDVLMYAGATITMMTAMQEVLLNYNTIKYRNEFLKTYEEFIENKSFDNYGSLPIEKRDDNRYELAFKNVSFKYPGTDEYALKNVSIKFNIGERMALVGLNGAGKTTLIKLLMRLYEPTEGEITLNGIDIRKYDYDEYTKVFSVVFQDFTLFDFPIDENIAGSTDIDEERLRRAIKTAGADEIIEKLPDKAHTLYGHLNGDGVGLSGGEAQKIAIARALYKGAPFVILDEPTAALDPVAEAEVYENFDKLVGDKTSIYISHRMSSCKFCDRIVVLDGGKIVEEGKHNELIEHDGIYAKLYNTQAAYYTA